MGKGLSGGKIVVRPPKGITFKPVSYTHLSGNVAIYACEKATQLGAKVVTMSDSNGYVYDPAVYKRQGYGKADDLKCPPRCSGHL